ncbi:MAG TPA: hypothetical protein VJM14_08285, partial [Burkholderiales bacterium]|nr:hypothetical protein [Burkholderiales bacterium]
QLGNASYGAFAGLDPRWRRRKCSPTIGPVGNPNADQREGEHHAIDNPADRRPRHRPSERWH